MVEGPSSLTDHALLDCGGGRKLERFGTVRVVRPAPAATGPVRDPSAWTDADLEYVRSRAVRGRGEGEGRWVVRRPAPDPWVVESGGIRFELACTPAGQVGLFPEQTALRERLGEWLRQRSPSPVRVLDLFAYTGGSTLAAAAAGAQVTYVDAARGMVGWMRRNLMLNGLTDAPVRSLAEDARRFVEREVRRDRRYDAVILDPPSFGRGPGGAAFRIETDLDGLLGTIVRLVAPRGLVLLSAHTEAWTDARLASSLERAFDAAPARVQSGELTLEADSGAKLPSGVFAWWETG